MKSHLLWALCASLAFASCVCVDCEDDVMPAPPTAPPVGETREQDTNELSDKAAQLAQVEALKVAMQTQDRLSFTHTGRWQIETWAWQAPWENKPYKRFRVLRETSSGKWEGPVAPGGYAASVKQAELYPEVKVKP